MVFFVNLFLSGMIEDIVVLFILSYIVFVLYINNVCIDVGS